MECICKEIRDLATQRNEAMCQNRTLECDIAMLREEMHKIHDQICEMKQEFSDLKKQCARQCCQRDYESELKTKKNIIRELQCELRKLHKKHNNLKVCDDALRHEINHCRGHAKALGSCIENLKRKSCDTEACVRKMEAEKQEEQRNVDRLKTMVANLNSCLHHASADLQEKCYEVDVVVQNLKTNESCIDNLACRECELQEKITELQEKDFNIQAKLRPENITSDKLLENLCSAQQNSEEIKKQLKWYEREIETMRQEREIYLQEISDEIRRLKDSFRREPKYAEDEYYPHSPKRWYEFDCNCSGSSC